MTDIQAQWIQEMLRPETILSTGISLVVIGGIILGVGKLAAPGAADARKDLIAEARHDRDNPRLHNLEQEIKSVRRMPQTGKAMVFFGVLATITAIIMLLG